MILEEWNTSQIYIVCLGDVRRWYLNAAGFNGEAQMLDLIDVFSDNAKTRILLSLPSVCIS